MASELESVLGALTDASVRYLVVGGVAVVLHGYLRTTADLDLVLHLEPENTRRAISALVDLGFTPRAPVPAEDFADAEKRRQWVELKGLTVFSMSSSRFPGFEVDLFVEEPFEFEKVFTRSLNLTLNECSVRVVSLEDLISLKTKAGRPQDLADIHALRAIRRQDA